MENINYQADLQSFYKKRSFLAKKSFKLGNQKTSVKLNLPFRAEREIVEDFVYQGFKNHYQADIQHFLPNLVSIGNNKHLKSVIGFRSAKTQPLFIEQYLDSSIETCFKDEVVGRHQIAEFGNLFGTNRAATLQLFIITFLSLAQSGYKKLVFCATPQVKIMFDRFAVTTQHLGTANPEMIGAQLQHWGSYYDTNPELFAIDVDEVISIINDCKRLSMIASKYADDIQDLADNFIK